MLIGKIDIALIAIAIVGCILIETVSVSKADTFERESFYSDDICENDYKGKVSRIESGLRPDCETEFAIIEFDWARSPKHYECLGQALVYASQNGKIPVCVLLARNEIEYNFALNYSPAFDLGGVKLRIIKLYGK